MEPLDYKAILLQVLQLEDDAADEDIQAAADALIAENAPAEEAVEEEVEEPVPAPKRAAKAPMSSNYASMKSRA